MRTATQERLKLAVFVAGVAVIVGAVWLAGSAVLASDSEPQDEASGPTEDGAISVCHQAVEAKLKAPATAEFGGETASTGTGEDWAVTGWVDAENGFGALIRTDWKCFTTWLEGTKWETSVDVLED